MKYLPLLILLFVASSLCLRVSKTKNLKDLTVDPPKKCKCVDDFIKTGEVSKVYWATGDVFETGTGERNHSYTIPFGATLCEKPKVQIGITGFDTSKDVNQRLTVTVTAVTKTDFTINIKTWADTKIYLVNINWIAIEL